MIYNHFKIYTPSSKDQLYLQKRFKIEFLLCEEGLDWYDIRSQFKPDTVKIVFDPDTHVIKSISKDVNSIHPRGMSIAEIVGDCKSDDLNVIENKVFDVQSMTIIDRVYTEDEQMVIAEQKIQYLKKYASQEIEPLSYACELKMITAEESEYLQALKQYMVLLNRVPGQNGYPLDIVWPELPNKS